MDKLNTILGFLLALSLATERIVETIKGLPGLSGWLATTKTDTQDTKANNHSKQIDYEALRKASIQALAIAVGTFLAYEVLPHQADQLKALLGFTVSVYWASFILGAMASGGSGLWNSTLDIVREVNQQKQAVTATLQGTANIPLAPR